MSETGQKLALTHPIIVLKSGLKNNWMKKLDRVNRPLEFVCRRKFLLIWPYFENHISEEDKSIHFWEGIFTGIPEIVEFANRSFREKIVPVDFSSVKCSE